jgi:hypothetical protein
MFPIRNGLTQGDASSPLLYNLAFEYAIRRVQEHQDGLKLNGAHQLWFMLMTVIYWEEAYILLKNAESLVDASKETGLEVNADRTTYVDMARD